MFCLLFQADEIFLPEPATHIHVLQINARHSVIDCIGSTRVLVTTKIYQRKILLAVFQKLMIVLARVVSI